MNNHILRIAQLEFEMTDVEEQVSHLRRAVDQILSEDAHVEMGNWR